MKSRTTTSTVTFAYPFVISGYPKELPAGNYEIIIEEELLQNLSFIAYQKTATYLMINGINGAGQKQMHLVDSEDWDRALSIDRKRLTNVKKSDAAIASQENL